MPPNRLKSERPNKQRRTHQNNGWTAWQVEGIAGSDSTQCRPESEEPGNDGLLSEIAGNITGSGGRHDQEGGDQNDSHQANGQSDHQRQGENKTEVNPSNRKTGDVREVLVGCDQRQGIEPEQNEPRNPQGDECRDQDVLGTHTEDITEEVTFDFSTIPLQLAKDNDPQGHRGAQQERQNGVGQQIGSLSQPEEQRSDSDTDNEHGGGGVTCSQPKADGDASKGGMRHGITEKRQSSSRDKDPQQSTNRSKQYGRHQGAKHVRFSEHARFPRYGDGGKA